MRFKVVEVRKTLKKQQGEPNEVKFKHKLEPTNPDQGDLELKKASLTTLEDKAFSIGDVVEVTDKLKQQTIEEAGDSG